LNTELQVEPTDFLQIPQQNTLRKYRIQEDTLSVHLWTTVISTFTIHMSQIWTIKVQYCIQL